VTAPFIHHPGRVPVLVGMPHVGTWLPPEIADAMTPAGRAVPDTDWWIDRLYDFTGELGCHRLIATHSRYVVDLNRPPDGKSLYPGASNTELVPTSTFRDEPIWLPGREPDAAEVATRIARHWRPYHDKLAEELAAIRGRHGVAVLFDAHSIASELPRFFAGRLPDINLGTADGTAADPELASALLAIATRAEGYSAVLNGRFKGGYVTRHYGRPADGIHAVQLELSFATYLDEAPPWRWRPDAAARVVERALRPILEHLVDWASARARQP
jgi:N-formylglutamate deformylase